VRFCRQTVQKTIQEMQTYAGDSKAAQRGDEKPLKIRDHGPDAFRYFAKEFKGIYARHMLHRDDCHFI
jgi:hypothetical protein